VVFIRPEQFAALDAAARQTFLDRLSNDLATAFPAAAVRLQPARLRQVIAAAIERAAGYGITWESALADFAGLALQVGSDFDRHPAVRRVLEDAAIPPNLRVRALVQALSPAEWRQVRRASSDSHLPVRP
jgi:hypothetical protein